MDRESKIESILAIIDKSSQYYEDLVDLSNKFEEKYEFHIDENQNLYNQIEDIINGLDDDDLELYAKDFDLNEIELMNIGD